MTEPDTIVHDKTLPVPARRLISLPISSAQASGTAAQQPEAQSLRGAWACSCRQIQVRRERDAEGTLDASDLSHLINSMVPCQGVPWTERKRDINLLDCAPARGEMGGIRSQGHERLTVVAAGIADCPRVAQGGRRSPARTGAGSAQDNSLVWGTTGVGLECLMDAPLYRRTNRAATTDVLVYNHSSVLHSICRLAHYEKPGCLVLLLLPSEAE